MTTDYVLVKPGLEAQADSPPLRSPLTDAGSTKRDVNGASSGDQAASRDIKLQLLPNGVQPGHHYADDCMFEPDTKWCCRLRRRPLWRRFTSLQTLLLSSCMALLLISGALLITLVLVYKQRPATPHVCLSPECVRTAARLLDSMNLEADPCEDFFEFSCGKWNRLHPIPEDRYSYGTFEKMVDDIHLQIKALLEDNTTEPQCESTRKARDFYTACIDTYQIEQAGNEAFDEIIESLGGWPMALGDSYVLQNDWSLEKMLADLRRDFGFHILFQMQISTDDRDSSRYAITLDQGDVGMPGRDYYISDRPSFNAEYLTAYRQLMFRIAQIMKSPLTDEQLEIRVNATLEFEVALAEIMQTTEDRADPGKRYHNTTVKNLALEFPGFNWNSYLTHLFRFQVDPDEPVIVLADHYLAQLAHILSSADNTVVLDYIIWRNVFHFLPLLTGEYQNALFEYRRILFGIRTEMVRWKQCVDFVNKYMGMAVGAMFVKRYFEDRSLEVALEMINDLRQSFVDLLRENSWMDDETRFVATEKANSMTQQIGYPKFLLDKAMLDRVYAELVVQPEDYFRNLVNIGRFESLANLERFKKEVDKDEWFQAPATVNAFYDPNRNQMVFPAGILQPTFYHVWVPKSLNFGGIGVVIGHEITHGFDDNGRQYDKEGNMLQWWANSTIERFRKQATCIIDQYSQYTLRDIQKNVNGNLTQSENIADNGGLKQAFRAYRQWVQRNGEEPLLPGVPLSHYQLFFVNFAQIWCGNRRKEASNYQLTESVHSPNEFRVIGPVSNSVDFAEAFSCPVNSKMNPAKKCNVW